MNQITYEVYRTSRITIGEGELILLESGRIGYDCAALINSASEFETSEGRYSVHKTRLDVSGAEAKLLVFGEKINVA